MIRTSRIAARRQPTASSPIKNLIVTAMVSTILLCCCLPVYCQSSTPVEVADMVSPHYPALARMARLQGSVRVEVEIGGDGKVISATTTGADQILQTAAAKNIRLWTFRSRTGEKSKYVITYTYRLEGNPSKHAECPEVVFHLPDRVEVTSPPGEVTY